MKKGEQDDRAPEPRGVAKGSPRVTQDWNRQQ